MYYLTIFVVVQAFLIQNAYTNCIGSRNTGPHLNAGLPGLHSGSRVNSPIPCAANEIAEESYSASGIGTVSVYGDLPLSGGTQITGQVPVLGIARFAGNVPASGVVTISGNCACLCE